MTCPTPPAGWRAELLGLSRWAVGLTLISALLCAVPLLNLLAYEFAFAMAGPLSVAGMAQGLRAARGEAASPWAALPAALLRITALSLAPLLPICLNALRVKNCNFLDGLAFYALLPVVSGWVGAAWGVAAGWLLPRRAGWLLALGAFGTLGHALIKLWLEPPVDAFHPLLGYFPGPLYDEVIPLGTPLLTARLEDLAVAWALLGLAGLLRRPTLRLSLLAALTAAGAAGAYGLAVHHGVHRDAASIQAALGGFRETAHFRIYYPARWSLARIEGLSLDLEFAHQELTAFFGRAPEAPIDAYLYASPAAKKRLMGAGRTRVAKPWQRALHLHAPQVGDAVTLHELAHVFSADWANGPHHLSLSGGFLPNMALIEGLAVAATWSEDRLDPHQWSAAMARLDVLPPLESLATPQGFFTRASSTAYTACGSYVRFLHETEGPEAVARAYRGGRLTPDEGEDLRPYLKAWQARIAKEPLSESALAEAKARFDRPSIFGKTCAHEIAGLKHAAERHEARGELPEALAQVDAWLKHTPRDPAGRLEKLALLNALGQTGAARALAVALTEDKKIGAVAAARAEGWLADLDALEGRTDAARARYQRLMAQAFSRDELRALAVRLAALDAGEAGRAALLLLTAPGKRSAKEDRRTMDELLAKAPGWSTGLYLAGRQRARQGLPEVAKALLRRALALGLPHPALALEAEKLTAELCFGEGRYLEAAAGFRRLSTRQDLERGEAFELARAARRAQFFQTHAPPR